MFELKEVDIVKNSGDLVHKSVNDKRTIIRAVPLSRIVQKGRSEDETKLFVIIRDEILVFLS